MKQDGERGPTTIPNRTMGAPLRDASALREQLVEINAARCGEHSRRSSHQTPASSAPYATRSTAPTSPPRSLPQLAQKRPETRQRVRSDAIHVQQILELAKRPMSHPVQHDLLGWSGSGPSPRFVRRYADFGGEARTAIAAFAADVRDGTYPSLDESYPTPETVQDWLSRRSPRPEEKGA